MSQTSRFNENHPCEMMKCEGVKQTPCHFLHGEQFNASSNENKHIFVRIKLPRFTIIIILLHSYENVFTLYYIAEKQKPSVMYKETGKFSLTINS
jgi:hypothetical protein